MPLDHYLSQVHLRNFYAPSLGELCMRFANQTRRNFKPSRRTFAASRLAFWRAIDASAWHWSGRAAELNNVRAGEIVPVTPLQLKVHQALGIRAGEFEAGINSMLQKGWIEITSSRVKLTDAGYAEM